MLSVSIFNCNLKFAANVAPFCGCINGKSVNICFIRKSLAFDETAAKRKTEKRSIFTASANL